MPDPIMLAVATTLAVRTAEAAVAGAPAAWGALVGLVRRRFASHAEAVQVLEIAQARPDDVEAVEALAGSLGRFAAEDREFDAELRTLWAQVGDTVHQEGSVENRNSGAVTGLVLQGGEFTVNGHLYFGGAPERR